MRHKSSYAMILLLIMFLALTSCGGSSSGDDGSGKGGSSTEGSNESDDTDQSDTDQVRTLSSEQLRDALYAAYAGIGYNSGSTAVDDDAPLYDVMFDDLGALASYLALQALDLESNITDLQFMLLSGGSRTFTYQAAGVDVTLNFRFALTGQFSADLRIDFDDGGFTFDGVTYTGKETDAELTAILDGSVAINFISMTVSPRLVDVSLTTDNNLSAIYPDWTVQYNNWAISYAIDQDLLNFNIAPAMLSVLVTAPAQADDRLYTLTGGFDIINGTTRSYAFDMTYGQLDLGSDVYVALQGTLSLPGFDGLVVNVSSTGLGILEGNDAIDTAECILRTDAGLWTSGLLTIEADEDSYTAAFNPDGSALLSPDDETVDDWQTALAPF